jgi:drug/metabolite transporter (DMT)-like permease
MFDKHRTFDALPVLAAALAWGAMFPIAASALRHVDPYHITAIRYLVAGAFFLALLAALEGARALLPGNRALELFALGSLGFAGFNLLSYAGLAHTRPQDAALIVATSPLLTALAVWLTSRRMPTRSTLAAMAVALAGVTLVISHGSPRTLLAGGSDITGDLLVLAGVVCWVVYTLGARRFSDFSPLRYTALSAAGGTVTIVAVTALVTAAGFEHTPSAGDIAAIAPELAYIILAGAVIAVLAWNEGVRRIGAANAALFMNLVPVVAFAIAIAQGYRAGVVELLGALLTIGALVYANLAGRQAIRRPSSSAWAATRLANSAKSRP